MRRRHGNREADVARVAGAELYRGLAVVQHRLAVAEVRRSSRLDLELMPQRSELVPGLLRHGALDLHVAPFESALGEAARLERLLEGHAENGHVDLKVRVRLGLVPPAHDSEPDP